MATVRLRALVEGRVQGVYFRDFTRQEAERLGLSGWVRNLKNGAVEAEYQGPEAEVKRLTAWLHQGSPRAQVLRVQTWPCPPLTEESGFLVRY